MASITIDSPLERTPLPKAASGTHDCCEDSEQTGAIVCVPTIKGDLLDSTGAVVPGRVAVTHQGADDCEWAATINTENLNPGTYSLVVTLTCTCTNTDTGEVDTSTATDTVGGLSIP